MIKVLIKSEEKKFKSLEIKGHANSAPHGEDLVCAGVSSVLTGGLNNLENPKDFNIILNEGHSLVEVKDSISSHDETVIDGRPRTAGPYPQYAPESSVLPKCRPW